MDDLIVVEREGETVAPETLVAEVWVLRLPLLVGPTHWRMIFDAKAPV